ncbi:hypothetical protein VSR34_31205 [Paraburkholderia sp. JHI2823]|uniref:hypothetical protein n=1 Tax=Paraburkholderia TaxID=1822464 RepID=UPI0003FC7B99|nr:hypothetical protein [Paraburkholderia mimosarum]
MSASRPQTPPSSQDDLLDEALKETFPASDPIAVDPSPAAPRSRKTHPAGESHKHRGAHRSVKH